MGQLKDKAKQNSKFLILDRGESAIVQLVDYKFVPNDLDPTQEVALFKIKYEGQIKFWRSGSARVWNSLDAINPGDYFSISRDKFLKKDGSEDTNKSTWSAAILPGYNPAAGVAAPIDQGKPSSKAEPIEMPESAGDDDGPDVDPFAE